MSGKSTILALNSFNCNSRLSNVNWSNSLNQPVVVTEGDSLVVRNAFLDTRTQSTNGIIIPEDTEISLDFFFYYINRGGNQQPSPYDTTINTPGSAPDPPVRQTGLFDFLNPLEYGIGVDASGGLAPQLVPPTAVPIVSFNRANDITTAVLIECNQAIPLPSIVTVVQTSYPVNPPIVSFDATNATVITIIQDGSSTSFTYSNPGPDEGIQSDQVGTLYTNGKLLPNPSAPNLGNKAPLVETILYPDFYGGFLNNGAQTASGVNENDTAFVKGQLATVYINPTTYPAIKNVELGWRVTCDFANDVSAQNIQESGNPCTPDTTYTGLFNTAVQPGLNDVQLGWTVAYAGQESVPPLPLVTAISTTDIGTLVVDSTSDGPLVDPFTFTFNTGIPFNNWELAQVVPNTCNMTIALTPAQVTIQSSAPNVYAVNYDNLPMTVGELFTFTTLDTAELQDVPLGATVWETSSINYTSVVISSGAEPPNVFIVSTPCLPAGTDQEQFGLITTSPAAFNFNLMHGAPSDGSDEVVVFTANAAQGSVPELLPPTPTSEYLLLGFNTDSAPANLVGGTITIQKTSGPVITGTVTAATYDYGVPIFIVTTSCPVQDNTDPYLMDTCSISWHYDNFTGNSVFAYDVDANVLVMNNTIQIDETCNVFWSNSSVWTDILFTGTASVRTMTFLGVADIAAPNQQEFAFNYGLMEYVTNCTDFVTFTPTNFLPIAIGWTATTTSGYGQDSSGTITYIGYPGGAQIMFITSQQYQPWSTSPTFAIENAEFFPGPSSAINYQDNILSMSTAMTGINLDSWYFAAAIPFGFTLQPAPWILISFTATDDANLLDQTITFTDPDSLLSGIVTTAEKDPQFPDSIYITKFISNANIALPEGLTFTYTKERPNFSNLCNTNNFAIPMNLTSGDGLPYLAYMNLSQTNEQGLPSGVCDPLKRVPIKKRWKMTLKAGSYTADRLAQILTRNMSRQKPKIQRNWYKNPYLSIATTPTDGINKQYRGLPTATEVYEASNTEPVPGFILSNFKAYMNGAFTPGNPLGLYGPSRYFLSKNPASYPKVSPLLQTQLKSLNPDYEAPDIFDDDDQPFLFRPTSYAKPNPLSQTLPFISVTLTQYNTIPGGNGTQPVNNPMTEAAPYTGYYMNYDMTQAGEGNPYNQLYVVSLHEQTVTGAFRVNYEVMAAFNYYNDQIQDLVNWVITFDGMDPTIPAAVINQIVTNSDIFGNVDSYDFYLTGANLPPGDGYMNILNPIVAQPFPPIAVGWLAKRTNLAEPLPAEGTPITSVVWSNYDYAWLATWVGDATLASTDQMTVEFIKPGYIPVDPFQQPNFLFSAGMSYNDANLFKWNNMQQNLTAPPQLVDVYFGPFLTDAYSPFFQKQIRDSGITVDGLDASGLTNYYGIRPVISQQLEYVIYQQATLNYDNPANVSTTTNFTWAPNYEVVCPLVGASEMSLTYNSENNGIFQFNYAHTPMYEKVSPETSTVVESTGLFPSFTYPEDEDISGQNLQSTPEGAFLADKQSGIILSAMEPAWFWQLLGFDISNCTANPPDDNPGKSFMLFEEYQAKTTGGFCGAANNYDTSITMTGSNDQCYAATADTFSLNSGVNVGIAATPSVADDYYVNNYSRAPVYYQVQTTNTIDAATIPLAPNAAGYWLIEITGYQSDFITDYEKAEVKAIVSNYFNNGGSFATSNGQDDYQYRHSGPPMVLSNLKVRVLNPVTMTEDLTLGPNNSIYLQLNKAIEQTNYQPVNTDLNAQVPWS